MPKIFEKVGMSKPKYSAFDLSHERKLSCKMGDLIPIMAEEVVPGDQFKVQTEVMMRLAPMLAPVMHRVNCYVHYFFVPNRILWNQWEDFITGGKEGLDAPPMTTTQLAASTTAAGTLADYLGFPTIVDGVGDLHVSDLVFRAYQKIYSDYYRDPNLTDELDPNDLTEIEKVTLRKRSWEKDYFTSALPWPQRGPSVSVPVDGDAEFSPDYKNTTTVQNNIGGNPADGVLSSISTGGTSFIEDAAQIGVRVENLNDPQSIDISGLEVDINDLRKSSALQRWLEKQARGGYRYIETILSHFGVKSSDARLQRAEYLGGGRQPIVISEVLNTTGTTEAPQGTMAGHGMAVGAKNHFREKFEEHGFVIGILSVLPRTAYQNGVPRKYLRTDKEDYYWPEFANLGEQEVKNGELYWDGSESVETNLDTWGYQQRYAEYKYACDSVHGDFKTSLDFWHMGRIFNSRPSLNASFVESDPTTRIFAVETGDHLWVQLYNNVKARRPMPYFSDPRLS